MPSLKDIKDITQMSDGEIIHLGLQTILDNLEFSGLEPHMQWQMKLRINRMIAGVVSDNNPEGRVLDYNIYKLGLQLLVKTFGKDEVRRERAERAFQGRLA